MAEWIDALGACIARGECAVLVTVAQTSGSVPREAGTTMLVGSGSVAGTIGGGHLEFEAIRIARDALVHACPAAPWVVRFPLAARLGQCCGGVATLAFALVDGAGREWVETAQACMRAQVPFARIERIGEGARVAAPLLVTMDDVSGTLGDAALDSLAIAAARTRVQAKHGGAMLVDSTHGGSVTLLVHVVLPAAFTVLVFGNGHVGRALVQVLATLPAHVRWIDGRAGEFPSAVPPNVRVVATDAPEDELVQAPRGACVVVMTHSHALDFSLVEAALARDDWQYLGLIGSKAKRNQFEKRLAARGDAMERMARVVCPIGATGPFPLRGKEPGVIAIAVAAEILARRESAARGEIVARRPSLEPQSGIRR